MAHKRSSEVITEAEALKAERQAAKANIEALRIFIEGWDTATDAAKLRFVRDLSRILRTTIRAAVL